MKVTNFWLYRILWMMVFLLVICIGFSQTNSKHVRVKGYYRKDGTYVRPHYRTAPNSTNRDNFSTYGNTNPYTGQPGWIQPDNSSLPASTEGNNNSRVTNISSDYNSTSISTTIKSDGQLWRETNQFDRIQFILKGTPVQVIGYENGFWKVNAVRTVGYIINETINVTPEMENMISVSNRKNSITTSTSKNIGTSYLAYNYESNPSYFTSTNLNLRDYKSSSSAILTQIPKGAEVKVIHSFFENWWQVYYAGKTGYVASKYLKNTDDADITEAITPTNTDDYFPSSNGRFVLTEATSLRTRPDSKASVVLRFDAGDAVQVVDDSGQWWWKVLFKGKPGWVKRHLLEKL